MKKIPKSPETTQERKATVTGFILPSDQKTLQERATGNRQRATAIGENNG
jgi:hypothetical protein